VVNVLLVYISISLGICFLIFVITQYIFRGRELMKKLKKSEESYRDLTEELEAVLSNIREIIFQLDRDGKIVYVNNSWEKLTGFGVADSIGKNIIDFLMEDEVKGMNSQIQAKLLSGEVCLITKDRKTIIVEFSMLPLHGKDGKMCGYSGSINDVTDRKQKELLITAGKQYVETLNWKLEKRIQEEVTKNRQKDHTLIQQSRLAAIGEMIASIGHQWRQPLNSLSLSIQDVRDALEFGEIDNQYIDRFTRESMIQIKHMSRTINDFRKFYKPNKEKCPFSVGNSIEDALSIFSSSLKNHGIQVEFEYRGQQMAFGFPNEYSQVVLNILTNARDAFVEKDISKRKMIINIDETEASITAEFIDNAGGIEPALLKKVFEPYFTTRNHGTGIGLYMTKMILENMNGSVLVENTGDGARFCLTVPKIAAAVEAELLTM
jgi:PAS domain S-box-containing protein